MTNNDILRRLRYAFDLSDSKVINLFSLADIDVSRAQISDWLKKDDDPDYKACSDIEFASFLNGFINHHRGKKEGPQQEPENKLSNNIIFRKLRIALNLIDDDILDILKLVDYRLSKHELSAFFRKPSHRQYRDCKDQVLRNFLHGLQIKHRPDNTKVTKKSPEITTPALAKPKKPLKVSNGTKPSKPNKKKIAENKTSPWKEKKPAFKWKED